MQLDNLLNDCADNMEFQHLQSVSESNTDSMNIEGHNKDFREQLNAIDAELNRYTLKKDILANLDIFVLDNSLRESTVGQIRGHTTSDKWKIFEEIKKVGFEYVIVESFNHMNRIGEDFIVQLREKEENMSKYFAFSEFIEHLDEDKVPVLDHIPVGLEKMIMFGIQNVVMELDLVRYDIQYEVFTMEKLCCLVSERIKWMRDNLSKDSLIFVNIRDFTPCMRKEPGRLLYLVNYLSSLPEDERIFGIAYEDGGMTMPDEMAVWTASVRKEMDRCGWESGHLITHIHEQWGMCDTVALECLANGATGIWAALCEEGAMMGHASSCLTIFNLIRMGNQHVLKKFHCTQLRSASRAVTKITTGKSPHPKQPVGGERALDIVFGINKEKDEKFSLAEFLGKEPEMRIQPLATEEMIVIKLKEKFGEDKQFTNEIAFKMKEQMLDDRRTEIHEEYNSTFGLAMLFSRSGGELTEDMKNAIHLFDEGSKKSMHVKHLLGEIKERWDEWDIKDGEKDDEIDFLAFYNGFMGKYFGCYTCFDTKQALKAIDMDNDGRVDWKEFAVYLLWAAHEYPDTATADDLISIAFYRGLIPDMQDVILKEEEKRSAKTLIDALNMPLIQYNAFGGENNVNNINMEYDVRTDVQDDTLRGNVGMLIKAVNVMPLTQENTLGALEATEDDTVNTEDGATTAQDLILREEEIKDNTINIEEIDIIVDTNIQDGVLREENTIASALLNAGLGTHLVER